MIFLSALRGVVGLKAIGFENSLRKKAVRTAIANFTRLFRGKELKRSAHGRQDPDFHWWDAQRRESQNSLPHLQSSLHKCQQEH